MKRLKKIKNYLETHFAVSFVLVLAFSILTIVVIFQGYLKREYLHYLLAQSYETEYAVMESVQRNVKYSVQELVNKGAEMATQEDLFSLAKAADTMSGDEQIIAKNYLYRMMSEADYLKNITAAAVVGKSGVVGQYDRYRSSLYTSLWSGENEKIAIKRAEELSKRVKDKKIPRYLVFTEPEGYKRNMESKIFHIAYPLTGRRTSALETEYVLIVSYSMDTFREFLNTVEIPKVKYIQGYIADEDGKIIYHKDEGFIGKQEKVLLDRKDVAVIKKEVGYFDWSMNVIMDESEMRKHVSAIYNKSIVIYFVLIVICVAVVSGIINRLFCCIRQISGALKAAGKGDYHTQIEMKGKNEIWQMAEEYNKMISAIDSKNQKIQRQYEENLLAVQCRQQAERKALESQINAHFICNTLGCINYEAIEAGNHQVSILIKKLSNILRYTFDQKCQDVYTYQEIVWIDQYLYLQKSRYESFEYDIDFPDIYNYWPCCKLMFQPFVENSILHGFEGKESGGIIKITAEGAGERLKLCIKDNGCGISGETKDIILEILENKGKISRDSKTGVGIGIHNVVTRMHMYYGENLDIKMETSEGKGTTFTFWIPIPDKEKVIPDLTEE